MHAKKILDTLLCTTLESNGSDLHIKTDALPCCRINGDMKKIGNSTLDELFFLNLIQEILTPQEMLKLQETKELDGSYVSDRQDRFRYNFFYHLKGLGAVFRMIPAVIPTFKDLDLPQNISRFLHYERGLVLVTGTTGSGKSTTLAALINEINRMKKSHIITIEDPVEFVHTDQNSIIEQRAIGEHTHSFQNALKAALREDPDIILVGEMRDIQTLEIALHAANSGHLVLSTLHTLDAKETIDRIIGIFPPQEQNRIRITLASVLGGVIAQRLIKKKGGGRCAVLEILTATQRVQQLIKENRDNEIPDAIAEGSIHGMQSFDQALLHLFLEDKAELEEILRASSNPDDLKLLISNTTKETILEKKVVGFKSLACLQDETQKVKQRPEFKIPTRKKNDI